jgi:hypothetical protein
MPGSSSESSAFPHKGRVGFPRFCPRTRFSTARVSRLQLFRYVQASKIARLPDSSYRCQYFGRAAEAFTSELSVCRYLHTYRICCPPDYRQLAVRGLAPRWIRSFVGCSPSLHGNYPASSLLRSSAPLVSASVFRPRGFSTCAFAGSARGISPRAAHRSGRDPLESSGSCHPEEACRLPPRQGVPPVTR